MLHLVCYIFFYIFYSIQTDKERLNVLSLPGFMQII